MDIRTGRTYDSKESALADGVPESDIAEVTVRDGEFHARFVNKKYPETHQSTREMQRRMRQAAKAQSLQATTD